MKTILKFLGIFFGSILLSLIFGYWFGKLQHSITGFPITSGLLLPLTEQMGLTINGMPLAYLLFFSFLTMLGLSTPKLKTYFILIGELPLLLLLISDNHVDLLFGLIFLILGLLLGELVLFIKKRFTNNMQAK